MIKNNHTILDLRTLIITQKIIFQEDYYKQDSEYRDETTTDNLRIAQMKIWMLNGDKVQTAKCISISAGIKGKY